MPVDVPFVPHTVAKAWGAASGILSRPIRNACWEQSNPTDRPRISPETLSFNRGPGFQAPPVRSRQSDSRLLIARIGTTVTSSLLITSSR